jgi:hypothetical protein
MSESSNDAYLANLVREAQAELNAAIEGAHRAGLVVTLEIDPEHYTTVHAYISRPL